MSNRPVIAAVDLGSNSFRLQIARVEGDQLFMSDGLREPVRLAAGLDDNNHLDQAAQQRGIDALSRFAERLQGIPGNAVRAVATNTLRIASNTAEFLPAFEQALGHPIDIIEGFEEARLIYQGVANGIPGSEHNRLVIDIGGGSTEFIIGNGSTPLKLESLHMGCVSFSQRYFSQGIINKRNLLAAEFAARLELQDIEESYKGQWQHAYGSSGTAKVLNEIARSEYGEENITREVLDNIRDRLLQAGEFSNISLKGLKPERINSFAGGFAIMYAAFCELDIAQMQHSQSALREGVLYDLWGRSHDNDIRDVTTQNFMQRYRVDTAQAQRVSELAQNLAGQALNLPDDSGEQYLLHCAALLHETGISVAHRGYHKHGAYILANAEMPGFSRTEQGRLSTLTLAQRGRLSKIKDKLSNKDIPLAFCLRLAVVLFRSRRNNLPPNIRLSIDKQDYRLHIDRQWLDNNPLTTAALESETEVWQLLNIQLSVNP